MASLPTLSDDGIALTHFIVAADVDRSARFYSDVLGGEIVLAGEPTVVALANSWIIINVGGGPTDDKPNVILEPPQNPDRVSSFLNIRVADIQTIYKTWSERGAHFLTPPIDRGRETRCYLRDPDGHLIEVGQSNQTDRAAD
jgi:catechol 2,3-dioxygenase-like lactoylglutathione lyase family enzyme